MSSEEKNRKDLFSDMPLPDMEASWQQMKQKLQEEKDDRKPGFFLYFRACALWGLLLLLLAGAGWYFVWGNKQGSEKRQSKELAAKQLPVTGNNTTEQKNKEHSLEEKTDLENKHDNSSGQTLNRQNKTDNKNYSSQTKINTATSTGTTNNDHAGSYPISNKQILTKKGRLAMSVLPGNKNKNDKGVKEQNRFSTTAPLTAKNQEPVMNEKIVEVSDSLPALTAKPAEQAEKKQQDSSLEVITIVNNIKAMEDSAKVAVSKSKKQKKGLSFSAGFGLQKQVPIGGQTAVAYNYEGRKNTLADQLPSLYARVEKNKKWFADIEFQYGSAQMLQAFSYSRKTSLQDSGRVISSTSLDLKKTYYHRVPLSFNYYIQPRFSIGTGIEYSWLQGAVAEKTVRSKNLQTAVQSSSSTFISIKHFNDSFLYRNQVRLMLQTSYQWKRFSFGLRYSRDLEPYIKFTSPTGEIKSKHSQSLQAMLKYRLWEGKKQ